LGSCLKKARREIKNCGLVLGGGDRSKKIALAFYLFILRA